MALLVARLTLLAVPEVRRKSASECAAAVFDDPRVLLRSTRLSSAGTANRVSRATQDDGRGAARGTAYSVSRAGSATEVCLGMRCGGFRRRSRRLEINAGPRRRHGREELAEEAAHDASISSYTVARERNQRISARSARSATSRRNSIVSDS